MSGANDRLPDFKKRSKHISQADMKTEVEKYRKMKRERGIIGHLTTAEIAYLAARAEPLFTDEPPTPKNTPRNSK